jgi:hypothetical protein
LGSPRLRSRRAGLVTTMHTSEKASLVIEGQ